MEKVAQINIGDTFLGSGHFLSELTGASTLVSIIIRLALGIAGIILLLFLIYGGIMIISSAGSNEPEKAARGKQAATTAALGFVVVFAAYWIVKLIEIITGISILG